MIGRAHDLFLYLCEQHTGQIVLGTYCDMCPSVGGICSVKLGLQGVSTGRTSLSKNKAESTNSQHSPSVPLLSMESRLIKAVAEEDLRAVRTCLEEGISSSIFDKNFEQVYILASQVEILLS